MLGLMNPADAPPPHQEELPVPRWVQVPAGLLLGLILVFCLAGSAALALTPNEKAPTAAPIAGTLMSVVSLWGLLICYRLVSGNRVRGGLIGPTALRVIAWVFLLLPVAGVFTGYFEQHTPRAVIMTAAYISVFFGLRSLATYREQNEA
jgi:hypothetical protein